MSVDYIYGMSPPMYNVMPIFENNFRRQYSHRVQNGQNVFQKQFYVGMHLENQKPSSAKSPTKPIISEKVLKSCLKLCLNHQEFYNNTPNTVKNHKKTEKRRKRVSFADAHGQELTLVKYLTAKSNEPPELDFLDDIISRLNLPRKPLSNKRTEKEEVKYKLKFEQPVSDYMNFKMRLESNNVCVENVVISDNETIKGTVKVKNIDFHKCISVIVTFDDWVTKAEIPASYLHSPYDNEQFDTFQFQFRIPNCFIPSSHKIEFCVKYTVKGQHYWDNNDNVNYLVTANCYNPSFKNKQCFYKNTTGRIDISNCVIPSLYNELPSPESNMWKDFESGRFY